jgi:hypothetical protein
MYFHSKFKQFPWAQINWDGMISYHIFEAHLGVYGPGMQFGFWSFPASQDTHDAVKDLHPDGYIHGK